MGLSREERTHSLILSYQALSLKTKSNMDAIGFRNIDFTKIQNFGI